MQTDPADNPRLTELEIKAAYTEDLLDQLNMTIYRQQQQIDALARQIHELRQQGTPDNSGASRSARDELPPHY
ncbi:MAG: SlyX family protein [Variovorax sp.]|nr:MAG: SlyX family protein [Variovorax sp.]